MGDWYWRDDIYDVTGDSDEHQDIVWSGDEQLDIFRRAAERIVEDNGADYYDCDEEEAIEEEMCDIIGLWAIPTDSKLYDLLLEWYGGDHGKMMSSVRNSFEQDGFLFFVTGCGYSIFSADLLGGSADGIALREFEDWIRDR